MFATRFFSLLVLAALGTSFTIPPGTPDGYYRAYYDRNGTEVHENIGSGKVKRIEQSAGDIIVRQGTGLPPPNYFGEQVWCGCGLNMNTGDCDAAVADLNNQIGYGNTINIDPFESYYSIRGSVVAFACNLTGGEASLDEGNFQATISTVTQSCGQNVPGTSTVGVLPPAVGCMIMYPVLNLCVNSEGSGSDDCNGITR
jgi:hypothetical protein